MCVGSGLDRSAGTAFRILETSPLPSGTVRILPYASSVPLLSSANANTFVVPKGTYGGPEIGKKSLTDGGKVVECLGKERRLVARLTSRLNAPGVNIAEMVRDLVGLFLSV